MQKGGYMNGVTFGFMHSYDFLDIILNSKEIGVPEIRKNLVEIPGSDGSLDFTYFFGEPKLKNRILKFNFTIKPDKKESGYLKHFFVVHGILHGTTRKIILDDDVEYYYFGTVSVENFKENKGIATFQIICDCEPYRNKVIETVVSHYVNGSASIQLYNAKKKVVPAITTDAMLSFEYEGEMLSHGAGTFTLPIIELKEGFNIVKVVGNGNVTFTYVEGRL